MPGCWKSEKELFCDTLTTYFNLHRHNIGSVDLSAIADFIDEIKLLVYLGSDLYNGDWDDFFYDIDTPEQLAKAIDRAKTKADELTVTNPGKIDADISNLNTLLDQDYCVNGIWPGTPLKQAVRHVIKNAQCENTPYAYYYYLLRSYKSELNKLRPINPLKPF